MVGDRTRPLAVVAFEWLSIASAILDLSLAGRAGDFDDLGSAVGQLAIASLLVALTLWITQGRSRAGRLVYTGLTALVVVLITVASWLGAFEDKGSTWENVRAAIETAILIILLWWPSTSAWLRVKQVPDVA